MGAGSGQIAETSHPFFVSHPVLFLAHAKQTPPHYSLPAPATPHLMECGAALDDDLHGKVQEPRASPDARFCASAGTRYAREIPSAHESILGNQCGEHIERMRV